MLKTIFINSTKCLRFNDERALNDAVGVSQGLATACCQLSPLETHRATLDMQLSKRLELCFHNYFSLLLLQVNWSLYFVGSTSNLFFMMVEMLNGLSIILKIILLNRNNSDTMQQGNNHSFYISWNVNTSLYLLIQDLSLFSFSERSSLKEIFSNLILNCRLGSLNISHLIAIFFQ